MKWSAHKNLNGGFNTHKLRALDSGEWDFTIHRESPVILNIYYKNQAFKNRLLGSVEEAKQLANDITFGLVDPRHNLADLQARRERLAAELSDLDKRIDNIKTKRPL